MLSYHMIVCKIVLHQPFAQVQLSNIRYKGRITHNAQISQFLKQMHPKEKKSGISKPFRKRAYARYDIDDLNASLRHSENLKKEIA